jgi:hypothetical protein
MPRSRNISGVYHSSKPTANIGGATRNESNRWNNISGIWRKSYQAIAVGDTYSLGGYNWLVIDVNVQGQATLLCRTELSGAYNGQNINNWIGTYSIRTYLNTTMYNSFSATDRAKIVTATKLNSRETTTYDNLWLLSASEVFGVGAVVYRVSPALTNDGAQYPYFAGKTPNQIGAIFGSTGHCYWLRSAYSSYVMQLYNTYTIPNYWLDYWGGGNTSYYVMACLINP